MEMLPKLEAASQEHRRRGWLAISGMLPLPNGVGPGWGLRLGWEELTPPCSLCRVLLVTRGWSGLSEQRGGR